MTWAYHYDHCKLCGDPLEGSKRYIGVCADCMYQSTLKHETTAPRYAFQVPVNEPTEPERDENEVPPEVG